MMINVLRSAFFKKSKKYDIQEEIAEPDVAKIEFSAAIEQDLTNATNELKFINDELAPHVTDVFQALGNYDVRFDFDPFSIDDCRCNIVSSREVNVLCSMKHVPLQSSIIKEDSLPGRVKLKLKDDFVQRFDDVCWEDFFSTTSEDRYFDSTKVHEHLSKAIRHAVHEVRENMVNVSVRILKSSKIISLQFQLSKDTIYRVNLFPSIRLNFSCENFQLLFKHFLSLPETVFDECHLQQGVHVVARPNTNSEDESQFWSITFNDIERRLVHSKTFECAKDCLIFINEIFKSPRYGVEKARLSSYQIQAVVLQEIFARPSSQEWEEKYLLKRLLGVRSTLNACLRNGKCKDVFTGVNLFEGMSESTFDEIAKFLQGFY